MDGQKFNVRTNDGQIKEAELVERTNFNGKDFAFYGIPNASDTVDIYASYIVKDAEGYETLADITNEEDLIWAVDYIKELAEMGE